MASLPSSSVHPIAVTVISHPSGSSLREELYHEWRLLGSLLGIDTTYIDEVPDLDSYHEDSYQDDIPSSLNAEIKERLYLFAHKHLSLELEDVDARYNLLYHDMAGNARGWNLLFSVYSLLDEQLGYLYQERFDCQVQCISADEYGLVFLFYRSGGSHALMQGISKRFIPALLSILYPEHGALLPRLNSLLIPKVEEVAKSLTLTRIYAVPLESQGGILRKHHGFVPALPSYSIYPSRCIKGRRSSADTTLVKCLSQ